MLLLELQQDEVCRKSETEWGLRIKKWPIPGLLTVPQEQVFLMTMMRRIVLLRGAFFWSRRYGNVYNRAVIRNRVKVPCQTLMSLPRDGRDLVPFWLIGSWSELLFICFSWSSSIPSRVGGFNNWLDEFLSPVMKYVFIPKKFVFITFYFQPTTICFTEEFFSFLNVVIFF